MKINSILTYYDDMKHTLKTSKNKDVDDAEKHKRRIEEVYGKADDNWVERDVFTGGFINFGYWKDIPTKKFLTVNDRTKSQQDLYKYVIQKLEISSNDTVLEIGCGVGMGLISGIFPYINDVKKVIGIDIVPAQIDRAIAQYSYIQSLYKKEFKDRIEFLVGSANATKQEDCSIDKVFSVEVFQHIRIEEFDSVAAEAHKVLKPGGSMVFCAHFSTSDDGYNKLDTENLRFDKIDVLAPIGRVVEAFAQQGFKAVCSPIGEFVFPGFEKWLIQSNSTAVDSRKIPKSYVNGYIEYYLCELKLIGKIESECVSIE